MRRSLGRKGVRIAAIITSPAGVKLKYVARLDYSDPSDRCTNNTTALLLGLRKLRALGRQCWGVPEKFGIQPLPE
jgi:hypothetical protein